MRGRVTAAPLHSGRQTLRMSWLEDFTDGEGFWERLMAATTFQDFLDQERALSSPEREKIVLYHAIREKQAVGEWVDWARVDRD